MSIAVRNVHTHELALDAAGNLYGEHPWYEGEDRWGHRVWRLALDGTLVDVVPATQGFLDDYSFVRDAAGTMYWADRGDRTVIRKRLADGRIVLHATGDFRDVGWMTATPDGTLYLNDDGDLVRVRPDGRVTVVARDLREVSRPGTPKEALQWLVGFVVPHAERHDMQGLWTDDRGNVYGAVTGARRVKRVSPDGRVTVVARSERPWSPSGGLVAPTGDLWLLEYGPANEARVRRVLLDGRSIVYRPRE